MPAYHSSFNDEDGVREVCGFKVLPIKTRGRGPAPPWQRGPEDMDVVDEALFFFKANMMLRNFEMQGGADRTMCYLFLYISQCINELVPVGDPGSAAKHLETLANANFKVPGDAGFPLSSFCDAPRSRADADLFRQYFTQLRAELGARLVTKLYRPDTGAPDKFWFCFKRRQFMGLKLA